LNAAPSPSDNHQKQPPATTPRHPATIETNMTRPTEPSASLSGWPRSREPDWAGTAPFLPSAAGEAEASRHRDLKENRCRPTRPSFCSARTRSRPPGSTWCPRCRPRRRPRCTRGTRQPIGPDDLAPLFLMALIGQEVTTQEWIDIPGPVLDVYRTSRPSPLHRARRLEAYPGTPARICYKYEGVSPAGSHKPNTAIAQAYDNKAEGVRRL